jgi:hypothetical protein
LLSTPLNRVKSLLPLKRSIPADCYKRMTGDKSWGVTAFLSFDLEGSFAVAEFGANLVVAAGCG